MTKKLNTDHIRSELADSVFFRTPPPAPAPGDRAATQPAPPGAPEHPNTRTGERSDERIPARRIITRNSFEIYEDQMRGGVKRS